MNDPKKTLDQSMADLKKYARDSTELQDQLNRILNAKNPANEIRIYRTATVQFPDPLLQNFLDAVVQLSQRSPAPSGATQEQNVDLGGRGLGTSFLNLAFFRTKSMERKTRARALIKKALKKAAIEQVSNNRTSEAYRLSEEYVFNKWCKATKNNRNSSEAIEYRKSEKHQDKSDSRFSKKNKSLIKKALKDGRGRIYEGSPEKDLVVLTLNKLLAEVKKEHEGKSEKQRAKDPENRKAKNDILGVFAKQFPHLALRDMSSFLSIPNHSEEGPSTPSPSTELTQAPIVPRRGFVNNLRSFAQRRIPSMPGIGAREPFEQLAERGLVQVVGHGVRALGSAAVSVLCGLGWPFWLAVAIILLIIILCIVLVGGGGGGGEESSNSSIQISKSVVPSEVPNLDLNNPSASQFTYTINVSYDPQGKQLVVEDPIPANADFVSADGNAMLVDEQGNETTDSSKIKFVVWTSIKGGLSETVATESGQSIVGTNLIFDEQKFIGYGFPRPQSPNPVSFSSTQLDLLKNFLGVAAIPAQDTGVDVGILGMWPLYESIPSTFYDNCIDKPTNPNNACLVNNWQVGYGVRPMETYGYLNEAIQKTHPGETVQSIGQLVITASQDDSRYKITAVAAFPNTSLDKIISGAKSKDPKSRIMLGVLMKDPKIGAYVLAKVFQGDIGSRLASNMAGWSKSGYYQPQRIINYIKAVYDSGISMEAPGEAIDVGGTTQALNITLRPKPRAKDIFIVNQAFANLIPVDESATASGQNDFGVFLSNCGIVKVGNPVGTVTLPEECEHALKTSSPSGNVNYGPASPTGPKSSYSWAKSVAVFGDPGGKPTTCSCGSPPSPQWEKDNIVSFSFIGQRVRMHKKVMPYILAAEQDIVNSPDPTVRNYRVYDVSSNYCFRRVHQGGCISAPSNHSFGAAIDINPGANPQCNGGCKHTIPDGFVAVMKKWGFAWGGDWRYADYMHFQWQGE
ncbi:MAG: hypothetical protein A2152_01935 [Candidatus Levybacteria bacterium RBG_16_35_6]|nr:MAG: hypothetical protein A2152_01935 [Candidatus Levybacteria bacterium RBG_16_35_6]